MTTKATLYISGYALLFLFIGLLWIKIFFNGSFPGRKISYLSAISLGALAFTFVLPVQQVAQEYASGLFAKLGASMWVSGAILVLVSGLIQMLFKMFAIWLNRFITRDEISWITSGLAVGLGYGIWESWRLVAVPLGEGGIWFPFAIFERLSVIGLHISLSFIIAYGFKKGRPLPWSLLAIVWHAVVNYALILYQGLFLGLWSMEIAMFALSLAALFVANRLYRRLRLA